MSRKNPPKNVKKVGTGLTQRQQATLSPDSTPEEIEAYQEFRAQTSHLPTSLRAEVEIFVEAAKDEFTRRKIPWPLGGKITENGKTFKYTNKKQNLILELSRPNELDRHIELKFGFDSEEWYLSEIIKFYIRSKQVTSVDTKVEFSMRAARLYERYIWKFSHEEDALIGKANKANLATAIKMASETAKKSTRSKKRIIAKAVAKLRSEQPSLGANKSALAKKIAEMDLPELQAKNGGSMQADTIRRYIV